MSRRLFEYHPVIGYRFIPGLKARVPNETGGYLVRVNSTGFRCDHEFTAKKSGRRRVLVFGDSFSAADGVSNGKRWSDLLEQSVADLEVYNFALPGTGTDQQYLAYREYGAGTECDLLLIAVLVENIRRIVSRYRMYQNDQGEEVAYAKPYFELVGDELKLCQVPPPREPLTPEAMSDEARGHVDRGGRLRLLRSVVNRLGLKALAQRVTRYQPVAEYNSPKHPAWLLMRAILRKWIGEHKGPVLLMPLPLYQFVERTSDPTCYQRRFAELAAETGCRVHDPLPDLWRYAAAERRAFRFEHDVHPTPAGHAAIAASLAPVVQSMLDGRRDSPDN